MSRKLERRHYFRELHLQRRFGLSLEQYKEMLDKQEGRCAICDKGETALLRGVVRSLGVDHNHTTGQVRELLCDKCNHLLGMAVESPAILRAAALYLEKHKAAVGELDPDLELAKLFA